ncbi:MAG: glycosyltransferase family 87 protein [Rickettsiales bacterium]
MPHGLVFEPADGDNSYTFIDFVYYYGSSLLIDDGNAGKVYDIDFQQRNFSNLLNVPVRRLVPYLYPPQSVLFFYPFTFFSLSTACYLWQLTNVVAVLFIPKMLFWSDVIRNRNGIFLITVLLTICFLPWFLNVYYGQVSIFIMLGIWGYYLLSKNKKYFLAGILVVACAFKPQLFIAPVLYILIINGKKLWLATIVASVATIALCSFIFGYEIWWSYVDVIFTASKNVGTDGYLPIMGNVRAFLLFLLGGNNIGIINYISTVLWLFSIVIVIFLGNLLKHKNDKTKELGFSIIIVITCVFSPWLHLHSFMLMVIPIVYFIKYVRIKSVLSYIAAFLNFNLVALLVKGINPNVNFLFWLPAQFIFIYVLVYQLRKELTNSNDDVTNKQIA